MMAIAVVRSLFRFRKQILGVVAALTVVFSAAIAVLSVRMEPARHVTAVHAPAFADLRSAHWVEAEIAVLVTFPQTTVWSQDALRLLGRLEAAVAGVPGLDGSTLTSLFSPMPSPPLDQEDGQREIQNAALKELETLVRPPVVKQGSVAVGPARATWSDEDIGWLTELSDHLGLKGRLVSVNGRTLIMRVLMAPPKPDGPSYGDVVRGLTRAVEQAVQGIPVKISYAGFPMRMGGLELAFERGWPLLLLLGAMSLAGFWYVARSVPAALGAFGVALVPVLWICGGMAFLGHGFDPLAWPALMGVFAIGVLGCGVGLALYTSRLSWGEGRESAAYSLMRLGARLVVPAALASVVALIPLSLLPGTAARDMAVLGVIGLVLGTGAVVGLLPMILSLLPASNRWLDDVSRLCEVQRRSLEGLRGWIAPRQTPRILAGIGVFGVLLLASGFFRPVGHQGLLLTPTIMTERAPPDELAGLGFAEDSYAIAVSNQAPAQEAVCDSARARAVAGQVMTEIGLAERFAMVAPHPTSLAKDLPKDLVRSPTLLLDASLAARADHVLIDSCGGLRLVAGTGADASRPHDKVAAFGRDLKAGVQGSAAVPVPDSTLSLSLNEGTLGAQAALDWAAARREPWLMIAGLMAAAAVAALAGLQLRLALGVGAGLLGGAAMTIALLSLAGIGAGQISGTVLVLTTALGALASTMVARSHLDAQGVTRDALDGLGVSWEQVGRAVAPLGLIAGGMLYLGGKVFGGYHETFASLLALGFLCQAISALTVVPMAMAVQHMVRPVRPVF